jgi:Fe-S-cluster containining protein
MCLGCPGYCCKLIVNLTTYDIARIALLEKMDLTEFLLVLGAKEDDSYAFKTSGSMAKFVLKMRKDWSCIFLDEGKTLKCKVEYSKPSICLAYPFALENGVPEIRSDARCPATNKKMADREKMSSKTLEDHVWEKERYKEMVKDWNVFARGDEPPEEFLEFALRETQRETTPLGSLYRKARRPFLSLLQRSS